MQPYFGGLGISHGEYSLPCALLPTHKKELLVLPFIHYHERIFMLSEWKRATDSYGWNFHLLKNHPYEENRWECVNLDEYRWAERRPFF